MDGQGYALLWDVNRQPKDVYTTLKQDLRLALGTPRGAETRASYRWAVAAPARRWST